MGIVKYIFHLQTISFRYNTITEEYSTITVQRFRPLPIMGFRVPINEEIWLPLVRWAVKSCDMGPLYWSQALILSYLSE